MTQKPRSFELRWHNARMMGEVMFLLFDKKDGKKYVAKPIQLDFVEVPEGETMTPTFTMPPEEAALFIKGLLQSYTNFISLNPDYCDQSRA